MIVTSRAMHPFMRCTVTSSQGQVPNIVKGLWQKVLKLLRLRRNIAGIDAPERVSAAPAQHCSACRHDNTLSSFAAGARACCGQPLDFGAFQYCVGFLRGREQCHHAVSRGPLP